MGKEDDAKSQKERAERLRRQIDRIVKKEDGEEATPSRPKSPRDLIDEKMRELDRDDEPAREK